MHQGTAEAAIATINVLGCSPLGWNILDTKRTTGGLFGYSSLNCIVSLNVPSSNGVSLGL